MRTLFLFLLIPFLSQAQQRTCGQISHCKILCQDEDYLQAFEARKKILRETEDQVINNTLTLPVAVHFQDVHLADKDCLEELAIEQVRIATEAFRGDNDLSQWEVDKQYFPNSEIGKVNVNFQLADKNHPPQWGLKDGDLAITYNVYRNADWIESGRNYLNIFVRDIEQGYLGYSPLGGLGNGSGVVIDHSAFFYEEFVCRLDSNTTFYQNTYSGGDTYVHELGHYLSPLGEHIFSQIGICNDGDSFEDTPDQDKPYYKRDNFYGNSCGSVNMGSNYLSYSDDPVMYHFTKEQSQAFTNHIVLFLGNVWGNDVISEPVILEPIEEVTQEIEDSLEVITDTIQIDTIADDAIIDTIENDTIIPEVIPPIDTIEIDTTDIIEPTTEQPLSFWEWLLDLLTHFF